MEHRFSRKAFHAAPPAQAISSKLDQATLLIACIGMKLMASPPFCKKCVFFFFFFLYILNNSLLYYLFSFFLKIYLLSFKYYFSFFIYYILVDAYIFKHSSFITVIFFNSNEINNKIKEE